MKIITKEQVQNLTPDQQAVLGALEASRIKKHQDLLQRARGSRAAVILGALFLTLAPLACLYAMSPPEHRIPTIFACLFAIMLTQFHVACITKRQDALAELLEEALRRTHTAD